MKKYQLHKIDAASVAKIYLVFGILMGIFFGGLSLLGLITTNPDRFIVDIVGVFFMILIYGLLGATFAALTIWIYNQISKRIGGITIYLNEEQHLTPDPIKNDEKSDQNDPTLV